jgi:hypothetical protein
VPLFKGGWLLALTSALKEAVGKASKQYRSVVTARKLGIPEGTWTKKEGVEVTLNVKLFCWWSRAAKEQRIIEAKTNAITALFRAGCIILRL